MIDAPAVELLDVMRTFSHDYAKKLGTMREALSDSLSEAWQETNDVSANNNIASCIQCVRHVTCGMLYMYIRSMPKKHISGVFFIS